PRGWAAISSEVASDNLLITSKRLVRWLTDTIRQSAPLLRAVTPEKETRPLATLPKTSQKMLCSNKKERKTKTRKRAAGRCSLFTHAGRCPEHGATRHLSGADAALFVPSPTSAPLRLWCPTNTSKQAQSTRHPTKEPRTQIANTPKTMSPWPQK